MGWPSEAEPDAKPPREFLQNFTPDSETFFVDCRSGMFMRGPKYGLMRGALENASKLVKPLFASCSMDPADWMQAAADEIANQPTPRQTGVFPAPCRQTQAC